MSVSLTLLQLNDLHGYLQPHPEMVRERGAWAFAERGGVARIATLFKKVRDETQGATIALDNGDTFHGTRVAVASRGHALVPIMNTLALDAMTVHWEFAYTPRGVRKLEQALTYPILAANCFTADDSLFFAPYTILERAGLTVAVIGLACPIVDKTMPAEFSEGIRFTLGAERLPHWIRHVRQEKGAELVVLLSHLGFPQDVKLVQEIEGIDVVLSGHTHNRLDRAVTVNGTLVMQSGCHGSYVGRLDIEVDGGRIVSHRHRLIAIDAQLPDDPEVKTLVAEALVQEPEELEEVIGYVSEPLHRYAMLSSPMDDVLLEALTDAAGTSIALSNGWRYGAPIPAGPVTQNDLWNIIPGNPPLSTVELTGSELTQLLEENLEHTFAADAYKQMGGYLKRMRGLTLYFKAENPTGQRIDRLFAGPERVRPDEVYRVAFVTAQGVPKKFGHNRTTLDIDALTALRQLFAKHECVTPSATPTVFEI